MDVNKNIMIILCYMEFKHKALFYKSWFTVISEFNFQIQYYMSEGQDKLYNMKHKTPLNHYIDI